MMRILKMAVMGVTGALAYGAWRKAKPDAPAAFAKGQGAPGNSTQVRDAGPSAMRDPNDEPWTKVEETGDESFPASDPPGNY